MSRVISCLALVSILSTPSPAQDLPPRMVRDIQCLKDHGLIQGTETEIRMGDAHFAVVFKDTKIGGRRAGLRFNGQFVDGKTKISPDIIRACNPGLTLERGPRN